jgi:flagellar motility protein MotE (MotC chaperone)
MNIPSRPVLNPFANQQKSSGPGIGLVAVAIIIGFLTSGLVLFWRLPQLQEIANPAKLIKTTYAPKSKDWDFYTAEVSSLMQELAQQRQAYDRKFRDLAAVEMRIETEKKELVRIREQIERMRRELDSETTELIDSERSNIRRLAKTYSAMKPAQAVAILAEMSDQNVVKLLGLMKTDTSARILGEMARTDDGSGSATMAARAASLSNQLRLLQDQKTASQ